MSPIFEQRPALKPFLNTSFDRASGQIFTEVTCHETSVPESWVRMVSWKTRKLRNHREPDGPSSLFDMCIRKALCKSFNITAESLGTVPWAVAKHLWQKIGF